MYLHSIDPTHPILGFNTPSGVPSGGGWTGPGAQPQITNLYSWLTNATTPITGYDYYPISGGPGTQSYGQSIADIGKIAPLLQNVIAANYPPEKIGFVGQAFSWAQEYGANCTSVTVCPYPTQAQEQQMRDQALYYAAQAGNPIAYVFWYYWPDITCLNTFPGCDPNANRAALRAVNSAPFPVSPP